MKDNQSGYTLVEMIVATTILSIMVAVVIGTYSLGRQPETVINETERLAGILRNTRLRAFNRAVYYTGTLTCSISGTPCSINADCNGDGHCSDSQYPQFGYGIHVEKDGNGDSVYVVFANITDEGAAPYYVGSLSELVETVKLPSYLTLRRNDNTSNAFEIIFDDAGGYEIYEENGTWDIVDPNPNTYTMVIEDKNDCGSVGRKGTVILNKISNRIDNDIETC